MKSALSLKQSWTALILFAVIVPVLTVMAWYGNRLYDEQLNDARQFSNTVASEDSLREFMVTYEYSESYEKEFVTDEEIANFNQYEKPMLEQMAYNPPNFEEWKDKSLTSRIEDISAFDLVIQSLGLIDLLFVFFGVGTAFKLGYGQE